MSIFVNEYVCVPGWLFSQCCAGTRGGFSGTVTEANFLLRKKRKESYMRDEDDDGERRGGCEIKNPQKQSCHD